jgi:adenylosuccinate lyase
LAASQGLQAAAATSRQQYHYSQDLAVASLLAELASIAQTWATDRRLEAILGLGTEGGQTEAYTVNSSAMPNKNATGNPIRCERICALAVVTRSHLSACAELAGMGWLEGDVSTSAARKLVLPAMFETVERILLNWLAVAIDWSVDRGALNIEVDRYRYQWATPIILQTMVNAGVSRSQAHDILREAWSAVAQPDANDAFEEALVGAMLGRGVNLLPEVGPTRTWLRAVVADATQAPIGGVAEQIERIDRAASLSGGLT